MNLKIYMWFPDPLHIEDLGSVDYHPPATFSENVVFLFEMKGNVLFDLYELEGQKRSLCVALGANQASAIYAVDSEHVRIC